MSTNYSSGSGASGANYPTGALTPYVIDRDPVNQVIDLGLVAHDIGDDRGGIGLWVCWKIVSARWRTIAALMAAAMILTAAWIMVTTPSYSATATLQIGAESPRILDMSQLLSQVQNSEDHDYYKTQYQLLQSEQLAAQVINSLGLQKLPMFDAEAARHTLRGRINAAISRALAMLGKSPAAPRAPSLRNGVSQYAVDTYLKLLEVDPTVGTRLVTVSFETPDPALSARIVNAHIKNYLALSQELNGQAGDRAKAFLQDQLTTIGQRVEQSEAALNTYRDKMGILAFGTSDQLKNQLPEDRMLALNRALTDAETERARAQADVEAMRTGDYESLPVVVNNPIIQQLRPQVDQLQAQYAEMASKYTDRYAPLGDLKAKLDAAQHGLSAEVNQIARALQRNYEAAADREKQLQAQVDSERHQDFTLNDLSLHDAVLVRDVETNRELYRDVLKRMHEISIEDYAPVSNISVVEDAIPPAIPSSPQKIKDLVIAAMFAAFLGIGLVFVMDQCDDRLKNADEIESYLHLPELGVVPDFGRLPAARPLLLRGLARVLPIGRKRAAALPAVRYNATLATAGFSPYKSIRTAILYSRAGSAPRSILVVSAMPGEGKTRTAAGIAMAFAETGASTLLVDADLRAPRCHEMFNAENVTGLSDVLVGRGDPDSIVRRMDEGRLDNCAGLFLLPAGPRVPNPGELLTSVKMHRVLRQFDNDYRFVVIDTAPVMFSSETVGLATMVDGVVVVAGATTPKYAIRAICRRMAGAGAKIFGVVVNRVDVRNSSFQQAGVYYGKYNDAGAAPKAA